MREECKALEGMRDRGRRRQGSRKPMKRNVGAGRAGGDRGGTVKRETIKCFGFFWFLISGECDVRRLLCRSRLFGRLRQYLDVCEV